ncbi:hypothetical protein FHS57_004779 [Runella defluvii]|uniref:Uncharacterized protein n=1 Tax=Runella defluvii TaxID=370973 RepID=A0A7W5ZPK5_9BACT|nr:hypothetical protein [Runella defluvii]MBB3840759.1 hypothetical protein [Runella defluvii]
MLSNSKNNEWYVQAFKSRPFQYLVLALVFLVIVYFFGRKSALQTAKLDQVNLPSNRDEINTITREQLEELISDCKTYFDDISLLPGSTYYKVKLIQKLLTLTDYELRLLNNIYNNRYVPLKNDNLYTEIENDWWGTEGAWRDKILARLRTIGAGKTTT